MGEKLGFFDNNRKNKNDTEKSGKFDIGYKGKMAPKSPDKPDATVNTSQVDIPNRNVVASQNKSKKEPRKTIGIPEEQYFEFMALMEVSEYTFTYELLGELIDSRLETLSSTDLRMYNATIESLKRKEEKRKQKKKR
ncbi:hypothetical protein HBP98_17320 [Listeria booriae]|uniref:Replication-associated protein n=2 Tax=Listeria booriae TaxID=1552123 RepID=A0A7X1A9Q7_9LIST|nr:hypothetical protein [Listeria booriae]MBC2373775.1 hypothetical protein [Listeria booriae]